MYFVCYFLRENEFFSRQQVISVKVSGYTDENTNREPFRIDFDLNSRKFQDLIWIIFMYCFRYVYTNLFHVDNTMKIIIN